MMRRTRIAVAAALGLTLLGASCSREPKVVETELRPTTVPTPFIDPNDPETPPPGVVVPAKIDGTRIALFAARDDVALLGRVWAIGGSAGVILLHRSDADMRSWESFAPRLMQAGYTVLNFDFRGYNQSEGLQDPAKYAFDVEAAVGYLNATGTRRVAVLGQEVGGAAAVAGAALLGKRVQVVATVGSGPKVGSVDVTADARKLKTKTLVVSLGADGGADLAGLITGSELKNLSVQGDPLAAPSVQDVLLQFLAQSLPPTTSR